MAEEVKNGAANIQSMVGKRPLSKRIGLRQHFDRLRRYH
jgi:hypothetical protein